MFLSSFEDLREAFVSNYHIDNLLHLGARTFDELSGEVVQNVAFVVTNNRIGNRGNYFRLIDGKNCEDKHSIFIDAQQRKTENVYYENVNQNKFNLISGHIICYWASQRVFDIFDQFSSLADFTRPGIGLTTGDNDKYLHLWHEVSFSDIGFGCKNENDAKQSLKKWFLHNKGGTRKWYGDYDLIVFWENDGEVIKNNNISVIRNPKNYYKAGITFPRIGTSVFCAREALQGSLFDCNGPTCFPDNEIDIAYVMSLLNSKVMHAFAEILCPTISFQIGDSFKIPFITINL